MDKNHPLAYILRRKGIKDIDDDLDMIMMHFYFQGRFGHNIPTDEGRKAWKHLKKLLIQTLTKGKK